MMDIQAIIFDLDDTLFKEKDFVFSGFREVAKLLSKKFNYSEEFVYNFLKSDFLNGTRKNNFNRLLEEIEGVNIDLNVIINEYRYHKPNIFLSNNYRNLLIKLKKTYKLGLITDGYFQTQENKIKALDIKQYFDAIIINDLSKGIDKTCIDSFINLIRSLNKSPKNTLFIGDNPIKDFLTPKKMGMISIRIKPNEGIYSDILLTDETIMEILDLNELDDIIFQNGNR